MCKTAPNVAYVTHENCQNFRSSNMLHSSSLIHRCFRPYRFPRKLPSQTSYPLSAKVKAESKNYTYILHSDPGM